MRSAFAGTTLLELIVAIAVTGIILSAGSGVAHQVFRAAGDDRAWRAAMDAAELRRNLRSWFANAVLESDGRIYPFTGTSTPTSQVQALLSSAMPHTASEVVAELSVDNDPATTEEGLIIRLTDPRDGSMRNVQLEEDAGGIRIRYLMGRDNAAVWTEVYTSSAELPVAIEITLFPRAGTHFHRLLALPILIPTSLQ